MKYATPSAFRQALLSRLKQMARELDIPMEYLRKRLVFERLLARLLTAGPNRWILKDALALDLRIGTHPRGTRDADLVGPRDLAQASDDLLAAETADLRDHFVFEIRRVDETDPDAPEPSVRYHVRAFVGAALFDEATIDVGFQIDSDWTPDVVTSDLLSFAGIPPLDIPVVPPEVQIAEKVHAYTRRYGRQQLFSTRPKDLIDLVRIGRTTHLNATRLRAELESTFRRRRTHPLPSALETPPEWWECPTGNSPAALAYRPNWTMVTGKLHFWSTPSSKGWLRAIGIRRTDGGPRPKLRLRDPDDPGEQPSLPEHPGWLMSRRR